MFLIVTETNPANKPISILNRKTKFLCDMYLYRQRSTLASKVLFAIIKANKKSRYYAGFFIYDFKLSFKLNSFSWSSSIGAGASIITSRPELFLGNAIKSLMVSCPPKIATNLSSPKAIPP